jgi:hypothetical protein
MWHLAQLNVARAKAPVDSPLLADFVAQLAPINALAEKSAGFVWRLQTDTGDATAIRMLDDARIIVNMTVWESLEALSNFVYKTAHVEVMKRRRAWFEQMAEAYLVLWWVPKGHVPTTREAEEKLMHLRQHGPTPEAFSFRAPFPPPGARAAVAPIEDECPAC